MSIIADIVAEIAGYAVFVLFRRMFHAVGRGLIFLLTFGQVRIPALSDDESSIGTWRDGGLVILGLVALIGLLVLLVILLIVAL